MKITCVFVEDEAPAMELLKIYTSKIPNLTVLGYFDNSLEAVNFLSENKVDVIFTDINMPQLTGIELIQTIRKNADIVFITANPEHAVHAFDLEIADYMVKPVPFERFAKCVNKLMDKRQIQKIESLRLDDDMSEITANSMYVKESGKVIRVDFNEIIAIEGLKDYVKIILPDKPIVTHLTMKKLEEQILPVETFMRVHKSYIINKSQIKKYDSYNNCLELRNKTEIPIGPQYKDLLLTEMKPVN